MHKRAFSLAFALALTLAPVAALSKTYTIDPKHTSVTFGVRHLFTEVQGRFGDFDGTIEFDPQSPEATKIAGTIKAQSIDTQVADRDEHLRQADFFDVTQYPDIEFESTKVTDVNKEAMTAKVHGNLTMHGVTKPVVLDAKFLGEADDPWGNRKAGFSGTTTIDRREWGLTWNKALEAGNVLVGNDVNIRIDAEAGVPKDAPAAQ